MEREKKKVRIKMNLFEMVKNKYHNLKLFLLTRAKVGNVYRYDRKCYIIIGFNPCINFIRLQEMDFPFGIWDIRTDYFRRHYKRVSKLEEILIKNRFKGENI